MRNLILLLLCTATMGLVSCKKDTIIQETPNRTIIFNVQPDQWVRSQDGFTLTADINVDEIDEYNVDIEGILVYVDHPADVNSYIQLPYTYGGVSYSYEHLIQGIRIDIQDPLAEIAPQVPQVPIRVKIILVPSVDIT